MMAFGNGDEKTRGRRRVKSSNMSDRLLKEFKCEICRNVMTFPLTTPCAHNFCKKCLLDAYDDQSFVRERTTGGRTLRAQKIIKKCPTCTIDISDFLQNPQVNRELMDLIGSLHEKIKEENAQIDDDESDGKDNDDEDETDAEQLKSSNHEKDELVTDIIISDEIGDLESDCRSCELEKGGNEQLPIVSKKRKQPAAKHKADKKDIIVAINGVAEDVEDKKNRKKLLASTDGH